LIIIEKIGTAQSGVRLEIKNKPRKCYGDGGKMQPAKRNVLKETRDAVLVLHELGDALRRSFGPIKNEPLPPGMALLLMQLALAEVVRRATDEECDGRSRESHE
jgi:hypothetical protein